MVVLFGNVTQTIIQIVDVLANVIKLSFKVTHSVTFWSSSMTPSTMYARKLRQDYRRCSLSFFQLCSMAVERIAAAIRR
jgi:hypothetical protein